MPYGQVDSKGLYDGISKLQITLLWTERDCMQHSTIEFDCSLNKTTFYHWVQLFSK